MSDADEPSALEETDSDVIARKERSEARAALPAVFIDTWGFLSWKGHIRITLGEEFINSDQYRFACVMELDEAEKFALHLLRTIKRRRTKDVELTKPKQESASET